MNIMMKILFFWFSLFYFVPQSLAASTIVDTGMVEQLNAGMGGIIVRGEYFVRKKGYKYQEGDKFESFEELIAKAAQPKGLDYTQHLYALKPDSHNKEKAFKTVAENNFFLLLAPPGEITITRLVSSSGLTTSFRLFSKTTIESGKLKYVGDLNILNRAHIFSKRLLSPKFVFRFNPEKFMEEFRRNFPLAAAKLVFEELPMKEE